MGKRLRFVAFILLLFILPAAAQLPSSPFANKELPRPITPLPANVQPIFNGKTLDGWIEYPKGTWRVRDGILASKGITRGVIYTVKPYRNYRVIFDVRHVFGNPDHQACVLFFGIAPGQSASAHEVQMLTEFDMLKGIQFQVPLGGTWDYRDGHRNNGKGAANGNEYADLPKPPFDSHQWSRVEIMINADQGTARLAVAQPVGSRAVEVGSFKVPQAGRTGPFALQMHNQGLFDEYANLAIEENPSDELITVRSGAKSLQ